MTRPPASHRTASKKKRTSRSVDPLPSDDSGTRLPYIFAAAAGLRGNLDCHGSNNEAPAAIPTATEERQERDLRTERFSAAQSSAFRDERERQHRQRHAKRHVPRLPPNAKELSMCHHVESQNTQNPSGGYGIPLSDLDERVLILYHSSLKQQWKQQQQQLGQQQASEMVEPLSLAHYGHEATYAATQIQKIVRGAATRTRLRAFHCPRNQRAAARIQFALRRVRVYRRVLDRLFEKRYNKSTRIQAWYRGHRCRELLAYARAREMNHRVAHFQRYFRGHRLWRVVMAVLLQRRNRVAIEIQRCYRGWKGRRRAVAVRYEQSRHVRHLQHESELHAQYSRCPNCNVDKCTEESLFGCFMVRYVGLHDFKGAKTLGEDGLRLFPSSWKFPFFYAVLLQAICEDVEVSMTFVKRAEELDIDHDTLRQIEDRFFLPALLLRPNDAQAFLDMALLCQSSGQLSRAEVNYAKALDQAPPDYLIPGYLNRVHMIDRLLLNFHRFCSIFNFRQVNVLAKVLPVSKHGGKVRVMVAKLNHYTVISPSGTEQTHRVNVLYLTDEEVCSVIKPPSKSGDNDASLSITAGGDTATEGKGYRSLADWRSGSTRGSVRQKTPQVARKELDGRSRTSESQATAITQLYQPEFLGLNIRPSDLAQYSETRSKLRLTRANAEILLNEVVFVDTVPNVRELPNKPNGDHHAGHREESNTTPLQHMMLIPSVWKMRQRHINAVAISRGALDIQRVFRGFRVRAELRRNMLLHDIKQQQIDNMFLRLHANHEYRELRRTSAIAIQRMFKGFALRKLFRRWQTLALNIQRAFRGYRGRARAAAFREGNCTFYMAKRVFQRGLNISGRRVMLIIEKCGLSFRLDGYDLEACTTYHGFFSHSSTKALLCYLNWTYAESLCGREFIRHGDRMRIASVSLLNRSTAECFVSCVTLAGESVSEYSTLISILDCIHAINLRSFGGMGKDAEVLPLPLTIDDTARLVEAMAARTILVPAFRMATREMARKAPGGFIITVQPPPRMHYIYRRNLPENANPSTPSGEDTDELSPRRSPPLLNSPALQLIFPVSDGLRGVSIGKKYYRKKCVRHAVRFTRCRFSESIERTPKYLVKT